MIIDSSLIKHREENIKAYSVAVIANEFYDILYGIGLDTFHTEDSINEILNNVVKGITDKTIIDYVKSKGKMFVTSFR
jgi:S-adenosylmethionine/arginine decarboxylase-like enzyme